MSRETLYSGALRGINATPEMGAAGKNTRHAHFMHTLFLFAEAIILRQCPGP